MIFLQTTWHMLIPMTLRLCGIGVLGKMKRLPGRKSSIQHVNVYPDVRNGKIRVAVTLENSGHKPEKVKLALQVGQPEGGQKFVEKEFQITLQEGMQKLGI